MKNKQTSKVLKRKFNRKMSKVQWIDWTME